MHVLVTCRANDDPRSFRSEVRTIHVGGGAPDALPADVRSRVVFDEVRKAWAEERATGEERFWTIHFF